MEKVILNVEKREGQGKSLARKLRKQNIIPAVCYRKGKDAISLKVGAGDLNRILHTKAGGNVLITLVIAGVKERKERTVLVKEIQTDPLKDDIIHVDFNEISLSEKTQVRVPVLTHGEAKEVVKEGGIVERIIWELDVECLPTDIPEKIQVDIAGMKIGDSAQVKDLNIPAGVRVLNDPELVVLTAKPPAKEEEKPEVPAESEAEEPEVIAKGKKEEVPEEEEAPAAPKAKEEKKEG